MSILSPEEQKLYRCTVKVWSNDKPLLEYEQINVDGLLQAQEAKTLRELAETPDGGTP